MKLFAAEQENYVSEFIASAGENPPEVVGPLPAFLERESGVGVNKMFLCVRHDGADGAADFDEVCAAQKSSPPSFKRRVSRGLDLPPNLLVCVCVVFVH